MKRLAFLLPLLITTPAMADWDITRESTKKTWSVAAFDSDKSGSLELQFYCDYQYPGEVQMLVFTGDDWTGGPDEQNPVEISVTIDGKAFDPLNGYDDEVDEERVVYGDTLDDKALFDVIEAAKVAKQSIVVKYEAVTHRFPVVNLEPTLTELLSDCNR
jgi:hypothetical protein